MPNQKRNLYIAIGLIALALLAFFAWTFRNDDTTRWGENYEQNNTNPYGLQIMRKLMAVYFAKDSLQLISTSLTKDLPPAPKQPTNYVFVGNAAFFDSSDIVRLTTFVRNGNTALLVSKSLPEQLRDSILRQYSCADFTLSDSETFAEKEDVYENDTTDMAHIDIDSLIEARSESGHEDDVVQTDHPETIEPQKDKPLHTTDYNNELYKSNAEDSSAIFNFAHSSLYRPNRFHITYHYKKRGAPYMWYHLATECFCKEVRDNVIELGTMNDSVSNFVRVRYGKGFFLLHSTPLAFTNYYLVDSLGKTYAENVLSYLPQGKTWWDEPSKSYRPLDNNEWSPDMTLDYKGPFDYLLSQQALRWAWYLMWAGVGLFLLFRGKRKQRVIPILPENTNTSLEFVQSVGRLYFLQNDHKRLANQQMRMFLYTLRDRFGLPTHLATAELIPRIVQKTGVTEPIVRAIFSQHDFINHQGIIGTNELIDMHQAINDFYKNLHP